LKITRRAGLSLLTGSLLTGAGLFLSGCNGQQATPTTASTATNEATPATGKALKVALLTPGDINDQGWNQLAYEGLEALKKETGAETAHQVTKNATEHTPALRDFADQKYDLVLCHGFEYGERVLPVAKKFPDTKFVVMGGNVKQDPNVATLVPKLEEATYLLGMTAAGISKSGVVGLIGGMELPVITSTFIAFEQGAKAVNPNIKILTNYIGNFEDQNAGKESAKAMIAQKADVLFHNADQAGKGMFSAAQEAKSVVVFGSNRNQNSVAPDICLASAVIEIPRAFVNLAREVQDDKFKADFVELNMAQKTIMVEWNDKLKSTVPAAVMKKIDDAQKKIESGDLKIKRNV
jgi:basic membrane lipoprotein Med (substrate-binding protein (PBP1-ABC) superfamily)